MASRFAHLPLLLTLTFAPACITSVDDQPPGLDDRDVAQARVERSWVVQGARGPALGSVIELRSSDGSGRFLYAVRNLYSQDLGLVDALGRAFRHRPHEKEPELLGSGTVAEGAARIFGVEGAVDLIEIAREDLETRLDQERARKRTDRAPAGTDQREAR